MSEPRKGDPGRILQELSNAEKTVLLAMKGRAGGLVPIGALGTGREDGPNPGEVEGACQRLQSKGLVSIEQSTEVRLTLDKEGGRYAEAGLPEERLYDYVRGRGGPVGLAQVRSESKLSSDEVSIALAWWKKKGLGDITKQGADTYLVAAPTRPPGPDGEALRQLRGAVAKDERDLPAEGVRILRARGLVKQAEGAVRRVALTDLGAQVVALPIRVEEEIGQLTPEIIRSGAWKGKAIRPYDVATPAPRMHAGKPHPLVQLIEDIREIFVELGFQEIDEEYVVSTLWNMDALFIPQDHPAREMQDTFYLDEPRELPVDRKVVDLVRKVHETGGGTGSRGWGGKFEASESARALLRTHTTVGTIRHLAKHPDGPLRVFSIGRVFRKETMDATHLPEFHQIEGIATEPGADFRMLLGILQEFYRRLGFEKLRWRPAFFPYTEPSMEVEVWTGTRWMELGGCGIFRPEVTQPFGVKTPVLAWGLGLERLAMLRFGLTDIRQIYISDIEWLRKQPLL